MATLQSTLKLTLLDQVSGRARAVSAALSNMERRFQRMSSPLTGLTSRIIAFGAAYLSVTEGWEKTYKAAANQQAALAEIGIKAGLTGQALDVIRNRMTALSPKVNQTTTDLLAGIDAMVGMGLSADAAQKSMPAIAKAATATGAKIDDLSKAATSAQQTLGVTPDQVKHMLDAMASAGNAGAFELRDMAQYFPELFANAKSLGMQGEQSVADLSAALQIARRGTGDASTAANNLGDFMSKIVTPQTIKNFKKFGVNVTAELKKAKKEGVSPLEHMIRLVDKVTKGGNADLVTQLFGDKQALGFIRPALDNFKDYLRIRAEAMHADGTVDKSFDARMSTSEQKVKALRIALENLGTSIGANLLQPVGRLAQSFADIFNTLDQRVTILDKVSTAIKGFVSGLGYEGGGLSALVKDLKEFIFGTVDGSKAADQIGRIFSKFRDYGQAVREFGDAVKDNPIVKFLSELSPYAWSSLKYAVGITVLAGAIRKLAAAMAVLTGASALIGIIKAAASALGVVGGAVTGATTSKNGTTVVSNPKSTTKATPGETTKASKSITSGMSWWSLALGALQSYDLMSAVPTEKSELQAFIDRNRAASKRLSDSLEPYTPRALLGLDDKHLALQKSVGYDMNARAARANSPAAIAEAAVANALADAATHKATTAELPGKQRDDQYIAGGRGVGTVFDAISNWFNFQSRIPSFPGKEKDDFVAPAPKVREQNFWLRRLRRLAGLDGLGARADADTRRRQDFEGDTAARPTDAKQSRDLDLSPVTRALADIARALGLRPKMDNVPAERGGKSKEKSAEIPLVNPVVAVPHVVQQTSQVGADLGGVASLQGAVAAVIELENAIRAKAAGMGGTTDTEPGKLKDDQGIGAPKTVSIDAASISAMIQPAGVQQVMVTNQQPVSVTVSAPITVTGVSDPKAAANSAASQLGAKVKSAVNASFGAR